MRVLFDEFLLQPFPHGREGDTFYLRFEPVVAFTNDNRIFQRGWGVNVPGTVQMVSAGPGVSMQALRLRPFELVTTTDSSNALAAWRARVLDGTSAEVARLQLFARLRLAPDMGRADAVGDEQVRRMTLPEAVAANEELRRRGVTVTVTADAAGATAAAASAARALGGVAAEGDRMVEPVVDRSS
jgi:hypothetical protein